MELYYLDAQVRWCLLSHEVKGKGKGKGGTAARSQRKTHANGMGFFVREWSTAQTHFRIEPPTMDLFRAAGMITALPRNGSRAPHFPRELKSGGQRRD